MEGERLKLLVSIPGLEGCSAEATGQARRPRIDSHFQREIAVSVPRTKPVQGLGDRTRGYPAPHG